MKKKQTGKTKKSVAKQGGEKIMVNKKILNQVKKRIQDTPPPIVDDKKQHYEMLKNMILLRTETEIKSQLAIAKALYEIKEQQLYLYDGYKNFSQFLKDYNKGRTQAYRYIAVVSGLEKGLLQEQEILEKGFKFAQKTLIHPGEKKDPKTQFLLSFSLSQIKQKERQEWIKNNKKAIETYLLKQINHDFSQFKKQIQG